MLFVFYMHFPTFRWTNRHVSKPNVLHQGQQAADLIARIAVVMKQCGEEQMMGLGSKFCSSYVIFWDTDTVLECIGYFQPYEYDWICLGEYMDGEWCLVMAILFQLSQVLKFCQRFQIILQDGVRWTSPLGCETTRQTPSLPLRCMVTAFI